MSQNAALASGPAALAPEGRPAPDHATDRAFGLGFALTRKRRRQDFDLFKRQAIGFFRAPPKTRGHARMRARCGFHVALGGAPAPAPAMIDAIEDPKLNTLEVYYGARTLPSYETVAGPAARQTWRDPGETGAALLYAAGEDGAVTAYLYAASARALSAAEDGLILGRFSDLNPLTGRGQLEAHWAAFRAYAEVTSVDGEPTWRDKAIVTGLRFFCARLKDGRRHEPEWRGAALRAGLLSALIILSLAVFG